jgi:hypothetical protein
MPPPGYISDKQNMFGNQSEQVSSKKICEDEDMGGPNCPIFSGPIAVYRFSFAMVLFFFAFMIMTIGVSTSKSIRAHIHNGFWFWKIIYAFGLISFSFKIPFFGLIKTSKTLSSFFNY